MPLFLCLTRRREKVEKFHVPSPFVRENINLATGQELESIRYIRATEKVPTAKNVGKILFSEREEGGGPCTRVCRQN